MSLKHYLQELSTNCIQKLNESLEEFNDIHYHIQCDTIDINKVTNKFNEYCHLYKLLHTIKSNVYCYNLNTKDDIIEYLTEQLKVEYDKLDLYINTVAKIKSIKSLLSSIGNYDT